MYKDKRFLGIIPARGGSVGVPKKNIQLLGGEPLLVHTIRQTANVKGLDLLTLSTDSDEIAAVGKDHGVRVIDRPTELATSEAKSETAILHALDVLVDEPPFDYVVLLEPTSPFRRSETISKCMQTIVDQGVSRL